MADTVTSPSPAQRPNLTVDQGAARLAPFGTPSGQSRPPARNPGRERLVGSSAADRTIAPADPGPQDNRTYDDPALANSEEGREDDQARQEGDEPQEIGAVAPDTVVFTLEDGTPVTAQEARSGYLMRSDYQRKTAFVAQLRNGISQELDAVKADREAVANFILQSLPDISLQGMAGLDGAQAAQRIQQYHQMLGFVNQSRSEFSAKQQQIEHAELQQAELLLPEVVPEWLDEPTAKREKQAALTYLRNIGAPAATLAKVQRDPWLVRAVRDACTGRGVRLGAERGRQSMQQRGGVDPTLPRTAQLSSAAQRQSGDIEAVRRQARTGSTQRSRMEAGVALLKGVQPRR